jgi:membrane protein required for colicin V production
MLGPLTYLDLGLVAICIFSGLLAMYRGLTREVLSILSWALAAAATLYFVLKHRDIATQLAPQFFSGSTTLALIVLGTAIFVLVLIIVHFITIRFSDAILDSRVGMVDRLLGFLFGVARGFLLVVIGFLFFEFIAEEKTHPVWVKEAQSLPYIKQTGHTLREMLARYVPQLNLPGGAGGGTAAAPADQPAGDAAAAPAPDTGTPE